MPVDAKHFESLEDEYLAYLEAGLSEEEAS